MSETVYPSENLRNLKLDHNRAGSDCSYTCERNQCNHNSGYKLLLSALVCVLLVSCGGGSGGGASLFGDDESVTSSTGDTTQLVSEVDNGVCGVPQLNAWVDASMNDYYLFYDQVPELDLADFDSPESLVRALRVQPFDNFSNVTNTTSSVAFFDEGVSFGVGFFWRFDENDEPRIIYVQDEAPAGIAGLRRGDIIVAVGGRSWLGLTAASLAEVAGTRDAPLEARWDMISGETGEAYSVNMTSAEYNINTVLHTDLLSHPQYDDLIGLSLIHI